MATHPVHIDVPALERLQQRGLLVGGVGLIAGIAGAFLVGAQEFLISWLIGFMFCLGLTAGCLGLLMLQHLSGGQWGLVGRRIFEAGSRTMPLVALMFIPIVFGMETLFSWARPEVIENDPIVQMKAPYLNVPFFYIRAVVYFASWMAMVWFLNAWSAGQDRGEVATTAADSVRFRKVSAPGLLVLVVTMTFASTDWVMSLDPHWFSMVFGLLTVAGQGLAALALTIAILAIIAPTPAAGGIVTARHFHDFGKLLFAFVMLWAYLAFSQFLIIWSANLPEFIPWYIERFHGGWGYVALLIVVGHFVLPFSLLLSRDVKRRPRVLAQIATAVVLMRLVEIVWLIAPVFHHEGGFPIHWMNLVLPVGMAGLWTWLFAGQLRTRALLPVNDPYFREAFAHEAH